MKMTIRRCALTLGTLAFALSGMLHAEDKAPTSRHDQAPAEAAPFPPTIGTAPAITPTFTKSAPALWKVADHDTTIYLFGTVHILPGESTGKWFTPLIASSLNSSDQLVTEVISTRTKAEGGYMINRAVRTSGPNLRALMNGEDRTAYEKTLASMNMPADSFDAFQPWYAALMLSILPLMKEGYSAENGVETVLTAHKAPKTTTGALETTEFQIDLFASLPQDMQLSYLRTAVKAAPDMHATVNRMLQDWLAGDADKLAELINDPETDPALLEKLLYARNAAWADWIKQRLAKPGTVFVAVGAGHLAGQGSVQDKLRERGIGSDRIQ